jgi:hypothetical protein
MTQRVAKAVHWEISGDAFLLQACIAEVGNQPGLMEDRTHKGRFALSPYFAMSTYCPGILRFRAKALDCVRNSNVTG